MYTLCVVLLIRFVTVDIGQGRKEVSKKNPYVISGYKSGIIWTGHMSRNQK
jgi:hypothetical protein